jgi:endonuclease YncB( thermonuclease family)
VSKKKGSGATGCLMLLAVFVVVAACNALSGNDAGETSKSLAPGQSTNQYAASDTTTRAPKPFGEIVTVAKTLDGDTFELTDGRVVDVLGIDSCDPGTYGGDEATSSADNNLTNPANQPITMTTELGVEKNAEGRLLRYVQMNNGKYDFGESMVEYDHTGVLQKNNGASQAYMDRLYAHDLEYALKPPAGRFCANPYPPSSGGSGTDVDVDVDVDHHDNGESRFCRGRWWC